MCKEKEQERKSPVDIKQNHKTQFTTVEKEMSGMGEGGEGKEKKSNIRNIKFTIFAFHEK